MENRKALRPLSPVVDAGQEQTRIKRCGITGEPTPEIVDRLERFEIGVAMDSAELLEGPKRVQRIRVSERDAGLGS